MLRAKTIETKQSSEITAEETIKQVESIRQTMQEQNSTVKSASEDRSKDTLKSSLPFNKKGSSEKSR